MAADNRSAGLTGFLAARFRLPGGSQIFFRGAAVPTAYRRYFPRQPRLVSQARSCRSAFVVRATPPPAFPLPPEQALSPLNFPPPPEPAALPFEFPSAKACRRGRRALGAMRATEARLPRSSPFKVKGATAPRDRLKSPPIGSPTARGGPPRPARRLFPLPDNVRKTPRGKIQPPRGRPWRLTCAAQAHAFLSGPARSPPRRPPAGQGLRRRPLSRNSSSPALPAAAASRPPPSPSCGAIPRRPLHL
jgi:hypothetical protein